MESAFVCTLFKGFNSEVFINFVQAIKIEITKILGMNLHILYTDFIYRYKMSTVSKKRHDKRRTKTLDEEWLGA